MKQYISSLSEKLPTLDSLSGYIYPTPQPQAAAAAMTWKVGGMRTCVYNFVGWMS